MLECHRVCLAEPHGIAERAAIDASRLFFLCEVNPMNLVTALFTNALLLFVVLIVIGGLLASPTRGFFTVIAAPMFMFLGNRCGTACATGRSGCDLRLAHSLVLRSSMRTL